MGRYKVLSVLGRGGMGSVYLVEDQRVFAKKYALKEMMNTLANPTERALALQQFEREASILATLNHPNLPRIIDYFSEHGRQYLVMEFVEGETLEELLANQQSFLPENLVIKWALQLCDVLGYLHAHVPPLIFRDLKPSNIMLDADGQVKLVDFGVARVFQPGKAQDTVAMGTPGYAAPEQYGKGQTDARSDIYALGVTLHHLLTKFDPSQSPSNLPPLRSINPNVSEALERIIAKALERDPVQRWQSAREMSEALRVLRLDKPKPSLSVPPTPVPQVAATSVGGTTSSPVTMMAQRLDFGTVLSGRIRWLPLVLNNRNTPVELCLSSDQPWIAVAPKSLKLRPGERRTVTVRVKTSILPEDSGRHEQGHVRLKTDSGESTVAVQVKVASVSGIRHIVILLTNLALGAILGLIVIGALGNLALTLFGKANNSALWTLGAACGGFMVALIGLKVQDTVNLALSLGIGVLIGTFFGAFLGALIGLLANSIVGGLGAVSIGVGIGLLVGAAFGIGYICKAPVRWSSWPF